LKKEKGIKSPLRALSRIFLISIAALPIYFFFDSKIALLLKTSEQNIKVSKIVLNLLKEDLFKNKEHYSELFKKSKIDFSDKKLKNLHQQLLEVKKIDSQIYDISIIAFKDTTPYSVISANKSYGNVDTKNFPHKVSFSDFKNGKLEGLSIYISDEGNEVSPTIFPFKNENGETLFSLLISIDSDSVISIVTEDIFGNIVVVLIILAVCILAVLLLTKRIVSKENKIKEELNSSNLLLFEKNREIIASISYAKRIQEAYLPPYDVLKHYFPESFLIFKPKDIVSGDFYWFYSPKDKRDKVVYLAAADCTGHGVPGAIMSVICCDALNEAVIDLGITETNLILDKARELVIQNLKSSKEGNQKDGMDITFCKIDKESKTIEFSAANNPLWLIRKGEIQEFKADKQPVGIHRKMEPFNKQTINYELGDIIYLSSDGYADQFGGEKNKKFKSSNMKKLILSIASESMDKQGKIMGNTFEEWKGVNEQIDDVCVLGIKF